MTHLPLGEGREFDSIRDLLARWAGLAHGIGDDAATMDLPRGERMVVSVDAFVEREHFEKSWITPREIGYRATAAALSDLAAMAAHPIGVLFAVNVPEDWRSSLGEIGDGVADAARVAGVKIVGGNIASGAELSITTTVLGSAFEPLSRGGAVAGQHIYVTGSLGGPGAAVAAWKLGKQPEPAWRERFARPVPRLREARWLAGRGATSCIDISDGVVADAGHIAAASKCGIELHLDRLPTVSGVSPIDASRSGEEYELLVTGPSIDTAAFESDLGLPLTEIGRVTAGPPGVIALDRGQRVAAVGGHDHFSS